MTLLSKDKFYMDFKNESLFIKNILINLFNINLKNQYII